MITYIYVSTATEGFCWQLGIVNVADVLMESLGICIIIVCPVKVTQLFKLLVMDIQVPDYLAQISDSLVRTCWTSYGLRKRFLCFCTFIFFY